MIRSVEIKKIILCFGAALVLNGCFQSTAMLGPSLTFVETQSIYQSGFTYGSSKVIEEKTGVNTTKYLISKFDKPEEEKKISDKIINLITSYIEKTHKILNQSKFKLK